jgi:CRISPR-associated protein Cmr6
MARPLYETETKLVERPAESNAGLWYDKFCDQWQGEWDGLGDTGKKNWIQGVIKGLAGDSRMINEVVDRRLNLIEKCGGTALYLKTEGPFVTGLGRNHPVENGFAWHQSLGTPYLPGSSVKGIVRSWAKVWEEEAEEIISRIFGPRGPDSHSVGSVIFLDAIPADPVQLMPDVMTPHYGPYYQGNKPPADWHNPVPIPFLVVDSKQDFLFGLLPRRPQETQDKEDCQKATKWLKDALKYIGGGAKTAVGYGRFEQIIPRSPGIDWLDKEIERLAKEHNKSSHKVLFEMPMKVAESWNTIGEQKIKEDVLKEIKTRYGELWDHPPGGLKKAKKIYETEPPGDLAT